MPLVKESTELRNNYEEVSSFCHKLQEPVIITNNGTEDLAVMSIDYYNIWSNRSELYKLLQEAEDDFKNGRTLTKEEIFRNARMVLDE